MTQGHYSLVLSKLKKCGGHSGIEGAAPALRVSRKKGSFLDLRMSAICKRRVFFFVHRYEVGGGVKIPLQSMKYPRL